MRVKTYKDYNWCSICGQKDGWYEKPTKRCPIHHMKLRTGPLLTRCKREDRWAKAY